MASRRSFWGDERGATAPLFALSLVGLLASGGIAWDVSRGYALRGELDAAADAAALAGATQLDGTAGARDRALAAAQGGLIKNSQYLANSSQTNVVGTGATITFLSGIAPHATAATDATAKFVQVDVTPRDLGFVFGALARVTKARVAAHAVAGYGSAICKVPPLMVCNPDELSGGGGGFDADSHRGQAVQLTPAPSGNGQWPPGNFGFLRVGNGANGVSDAVARNPPLTECYGTVALTEPGNMSSVDKWINTRFDIYANGQVAGLKNNPAYAPALNTIIGVQAAANSSCNVTPTAPSNNCATTAAIPNGMGLPIDCGQTGIFGSGTWNAARYFNTNHSGVNPAAAPAAPSNPEFSGAGWAAYGPPSVSGMSPTRFQVYNWELAMLNYGSGNGLPATPMVSGAFSGGQAGTSGSRDFARPTCNTSNPAPTPPDRRTLSAVVVNCKADNVHGQSTVNIISYVDLFLIAPVVGGNLYAEVIGATTNVSAVGKETRKYSVRLYE